MKIWHIRMRDKYIRNFITDGIVSFDFVRLERNIADLLIKGLMHQQQIYMSCREEWDYSPWISCNNGHPSPHEWRSHGMEFNG